MSYRSTAPRLGDTDAVLLYKIAQSLNAGAAMGDTSNDLLRKIAAAAAAATGGGGADGTFTNLFSTNSTSTNGTFTNLTAVNATITNLTTSNLDSLDATINGPVVIAPTTNVVQLKLIDSPGQSVQAFQIFQNDGVTQVFGVNFSGSTQVFRQAADNSGASLNHLKRGATGDATAAVVVAGQLSQDNYQAWDGTAFVTGAQVMVVARETFSATARGSQFEFRAAAIGATALSQIATFSTTSIAFNAGINILVNGAAAVAGLTGGIIIADDASPSANPVAATALYSNGGQFLYRTSSANEGSGGGNRVHNRGSRVVGTGADYALTTTSARVDFGGVDVELALPTSGTYLLVGVIGFTGGATITDLLSVKLRNSTDSVDVTADTVDTVAVAGRQFTVTLNCVVTFNTVVTIQLFARNQNNAAGSVISTLTHLSYVRLS